MESTQEIKLDTVYEEVDSDIDENTQSHIILETYNSMPSRPHLTANDARDPREIA